MKKKTILIIGGSGFFGKSILEYFSQHTYLKKKINKIIIINRRNINSDVFYNVKKNYKFQKINKNILKLKKIPTADFVIYCALLKNFNDDHLALKHYMNLAKNYHKNSRILYISSGAVYGRQSKNIKKVKESYAYYKKKKNYLGKGYKKNYSSLKRKNEKIFKQLGDYGIKISIARCFTFVGRFLPRNSKYAVGNFIDNILKNKNIFIKSNYNVFRSYMYVDDLVRWLIKIVENSTKSCPTYNVGSENSVNIHKFGRILAKKYNLNCQETNIEKNKYDIYVPSTLKIKKELNLECSYSSIAAVTKTIALLKNGKNQN